jgi:hypothetical protein
VFCCFPFQSLPSSVPVPRQVLICHHGITWYVLFLSLDSFTWHNDLRFISFMYSFPGSLVLLIVELYSNAWTCLHLLYSSINGHLFCFIFSFLVLANKDAMKINEQIFLSSVKKTFVSHLYKPRSWMARSYSEYIFKCFKK